MVSVANNLLQDSEWLHVAYIDDLDLDIKNMIGLAPRISVDFCTQKNRNKYKNLIDELDLVFDSRKRAHLYNNIKSTTPIILRDEMGCEAIFMGEIVDRTTIKPFKNLNTHGANDIFAAVFIREYLTSSMSNAIKFTSHFTTKILRERVSE